MYVYFAQANPVEALARNGSSAPSEEWPTSFWTFFYAVQTLPCNGCLSLFQENSIRLYILVN